MQNKVLQGIKATISSIIVALLITGILILVIQIFLGQKIDEVILLVNKITIIKNENKETTVPTISREEKIIKNYPEYGTQYGTIKIERINKELPIYFGDTLDILKKGVGHSSGSYFPGEGGSIIYMGHNSEKMFRRFSELKINDKITVTTSYGEYTYKIYDMQLIKETELDKLPVQKEKEILMVYTCYPFNNIGYATKRYVVYAELEQ